MEMFVGDFKALQGPLGDTKKLFEAQNRPGN
jgi:hypothetical protein